MKRFTAMLLGIVCLWAGHLMSNSDAMAQDKSGGVLVVAYNQSPRHLNPALQSGTGRDFRAPRFSPLPCGSEVAGSPSPIWPSPGSSATTRKP